MLKKLSCIFNLSKTVPFQQKDIKNFIKTCNFVICLPYKQNFIEVKYRYETILIRTHKIVFEFLIGSTI